MVYKAALNTAKVEMVFQQNGEVTENVFHVQGAGAWTNTSLIALCNAFINWETASARANRSNLTSLSTVKATDLTTQTGPVAMVSAGIAGTITGAALPNNATIAVKAETALRGRAYRGRVYWVGLAASQITATAQALTSTANNAIVSALNVLRATALPNSGVLVVASWQQNGVPSNPAVLTPITAYDTVDGYIDSQRRRLPLHNVHR